MAASPAAAAPIDPETLSGAEAAQLLKAGTLTSVGLTQLYIDRINALNKRGPGLNAVTQFNKEALVEADASDKRRAAGKLLGPGDGLPILLKDIVDAKPMYTSAGNYSLRNSFPAEDSGVAKNLRAKGVVVLGKLGLSEFANFFGNQPSGFSDLTGQVVNGIDADRNPSGSSSGSGAAGAAALSSLTIGTETSGSIISPSRAQGIVGLRPTVGLVPGYGIAPIFASQDTAGPMVRTIADSAITLQSIAGGNDPKADAEYREVFGDDYLATGVIPTPPAEVPDYLSALDLEFVRGKRIGFTNTKDPDTGEPQLPPDGTPLRVAYDALVAAGAVLVPAVDQGSRNGLAASEGDYEAHKTIDSYYANLGTDVPVHNMDEEVAANRAEAQQALKFGNSTHFRVQQTDTTPGGARETAFRANIVQRKKIYHDSVDIVMQNGTPDDPSDDIIALIGSLASTPQAGYPQITLPMGYEPTRRYAQDVSIYGGAYTERDLIGVSYVIEQATKLRQPASVVSPSQYRCAKTVPAPRFSERGDCNPDYDAATALAGGAPDLPFKLETESAKSLEDRMNAGTLSSEQLTRSYLARIALTNAEGPATQAVRSLNASAIADAKASDAERAKNGPRGRLEGLPILLSDSIDARGLATTGGSIALQNAKPFADATLVAKLKAEGAVVLGKTNVSELGGVFSSTMPEGYSSLGGQVLLPSNTDVNPGGTGGGSAAATASGLAALTISSETSTGAAELVLPSALAGVVGIKPTVGRVSRAGTMPVARSQDSPGPIGRTVRDAAMGLQTIAGIDDADPATAGAGAVPNYLAGLRTNALAGKKIAVIAPPANPPFSTNEVNGASTYPAAVQALQDLGATVGTVTVGTPSPNPPSIVGREFKRDLNDYLQARSGTGANSLQEIIDENTANPEEGLKYQQDELLDAQAVDLSDPATATAYEGDRSSGQASNAQLIDDLLASGGYDAIMVPSNIQALTTYADRAGYPVLTVPAGVGAIPSGVGTTNRDPQGVTFVGTADSEAELLADGYAYEQGTKLRQAPSVTNPSMWRCVPGSVFFTQEKCHPGDRAYVTAFTPVSAAPAPSTSSTGPGTPNTPTPAPTPAAPSPTPSAASPGPVTSQPVLSDVFDFGPATRDFLQAVQLKKSIRLRLSGGNVSLRFRERFVEKGTADYFIRYTFKARGKARTVTLARKRLNPQRSITRRVKLRLTAKQRRLLTRYPKGALRLRTKFKSAGTRRVITSDRLVLRGVVKRKK